MMDHALQPRRFGRPASFLGMAVATLILFGAPACDDTLVPPPGGGACTVGGLVYPDGATGIPSGDCNSCSCSHGQVACTTIACNTCGGLQGKTCSGALYCNFPQSSQCGAADATGVCATIPQACTEQFAPVCGCDGKTYGNACLAAAASTSVASEGACSAPPGSCVLGGVTYPNGTGNIPAADGCNTCTCADGSLLCTLRACPVARACGARAGNTCTANEYCAYVEGEYCGGADAEAVCQTRPTACDAIYAPVCGCDGQTHANACAAAQAGTGVLHAGRC